MKMVDPTASWTFSARHCRRPTIKTDARGESVRLARINPCLLLARTIVHTHIDFTFFTRSISLAYDWSIKSVQLPLLR